MWYPEVRSRQRKKDEIWFLPTIEPVGDSSLRNKPLMAEHIGGETPKAAHTRIPLVTCVCSHRHQWEAHGLLGEKVRSAVS